MIRILTVNDKHEVHTYDSLEVLEQLDYTWCWIDFDQPSDHESRYLDTYFKFHPLAIEDCFHQLQRPKLDHYDNSHFLILQAIDEKTLQASEINLFITTNKIVTFHNLPSQEVDKAWKKIMDQSGTFNHDSIYGMYLIIDKIVDGYFPCVYNLGDQLDELDGLGKEVSIEILLDNIFDIRTKLRTIRKTIVPMRELLYRLLSTEKIEGLQAQLPYFRDIYDHLFKLGETIETYRELTADLRDSYVSINSYRMNKIMKTLTVITTIFMPLTFIAGIYGMNFQHMPELTWSFGYYLILTLMFAIAAGMFMWFKVKNWFRT